VTLSLLLVLLGERLSGFLWIVDLAWGAGRGNRW
jgi:hypothetical protein